MNIPVLDRPIARLMELDQASVFAIADMAAERVRQIEVSGENWTPAHDDAHESGELALAAGCYALRSAKKPRTSKGQYVYKSECAPEAWPWHRQWWKPKSPHRDRIRAGALLIAELAKHLRSAPSGA